MGENEMNMKDIYFMIQRVVLIALFYRKTGMSTLF